MTYLATNAGITSNNSNSCHQLNLNDQNSSSNSNIRIQTKSYEIESQ